MSERRTNPAELSRINGREQAASRGFLRDLRGSTAIEYALIAGLIFAVVASSIKLYGSKVDGVYGRIGSMIAQAN